MQYENYNNSHTPHHPLNSGAHRLNTSGSNLSNGFQNQSTYEEKEIKVLDDEEIAGFLFKKGAKGIVQSWRKRWFVVRKNSRLIEYYRSIPTAESNVEPLGSIDIASILQITVSENPKKDKKDFPFQIATPNRIYYLYATEEQIMQYWIRELSRVMNRLKCSTSTPPSSSPLSSSNSISSLLSSSSSSSLSSSADLTSEVEEMNTPKAGQLFVNVIEAKDMNLSIEKGHLGVYCVSTLERQCVRTTVVNDFSHISWNEGCFFDITEISSFDGKRTELTISVWVQDTSQSGGHCLGQLTIPITSLLHQKPVHQSFKLQSCKSESSNNNNNNNNNRSPKGSLTLKLLFTQTQEKINKDNFEILKVVGKGNFGKVMQVRKKDTGRIYAMKVLRKDTVIAADAVRHTLSETNVLRRLHHPFIVNLKYSFQTQEKLYIIMDYLSGGELYHHLSSVDRFPEDLARFYAAEIVEAIGYLHDRNIIYRDLKPENLLLDMDGHVCLTDFGLVKDNISHSDFTHTFCGSPEYLAPEVIMGKAYNKEVDWWSFGTFLYEMLEGLPPFYDENIIEMNKKILYSPIYFEPAHFSPEAKSLLRGLLQRDPKLRMGNGKNDYNEIKSHPFFKSIDWEKLARREIEPPFKPHLKGVEDVRYFDPEFTTQTPKDTPISQTRYVNHAENLFAGFTYVSSSFEQQIERRRKLKQNHNSDDHHFNNSHNNNNNNDSPNSNNNGVDPTSSRFNFKSDNQVENISV